MASNQEAIESYHDFKKTLQLENTKHLEIDELYLINRSNAMEDFISNRQGTRRYYEFFNHNYEKLFEVLSGYTNEKMSTIKILKDFPELKDILDIDDHYELHAIIRMLSRRYKNKIPNVSVSRSPMLTFGNNDF